MSEENSGYQKLNIEWITNELNNFLKDDEINYMMKSESNELISQIVDMFKFINTLYLIEQSGYDDDKVWPHELDWQKSIKRASDIVVSLDKMTILSFSGRYIFDKKKLFIKKIVTTIITLEKKLDMVMKSKKIIMELFYADFIIKQKKSKSDFISSAKLIAVKTMIPPIFDEKIIESDSNELHDKDMNYESWKLIWPFIRLSKNDIGFGLFKCFGDNTKPRFISNKTRKYIKKIIPKLKHYILKLQELYIHAISHHFNENLYNDYILFENAVVIIKKLFIEIE